MPRTSGWGQGGLPASSSQRSRRGARQAEANPEQPAASRTSDSRAHCAGRRLPASAPATGRQREHTQAAVLAEPQLPALPGSPRRWPSQRPRVARGCAAPPDAVRRALVDSSGASAPPRGPQGCRRPRWCLARRPGGAAGRSMQGPAEAPVAAVAATLLLPAEATVAQRERALARHMAPRAHPQGLRAHKSAQCSCAGRQGLFQRAAAATATGPRPIPTRELSIC